MPRLVDMTGKIFGRLTVKERDQSVSKNAKWFCQCSCGNVTSVYYQALVRGKSKSCGCLRTEVTVERMSTHRSSNTTEYFIWSHMHRRCKDSENPAYKNYGARGITVCTRWEDFEVFLNDMGRRPRGLTLERKNNSLGYSPENCIWASRKEQARNTRGNRIVNFNGVDMPVIVACELSGVPPTTVYSRIHREWPNELWFSPVGTRR